MMIVVRRTYKEPIAPDPATHHHSSTGIIRGMLHFLQLWARQSRYTDSIRFDTIGDDDDSSHAYYYYYYSYYYYS